MRGSVSKKRLFVGMKGQFWPQVVYHVVQRQPIRSSGFAPDPHINIAKRQHTPAALDRDPKRCGIPAPSALFHDRRLEYLAGGYCATRIPRKRRLLAHGKIPILDRYFATQVAKYWGMPAVICDKVRRDSVDCTCVRAINGDDAARAEARDKTHAVSTRGCSACRDCGGTHTHTPTCGCDVGSAA